MLLASIFALAASCVALWFSIRNHRAVSARGRAQARMIETQTFTRLNAERNRLLRKSQHLFLDDEEAAQLNTATALIDEHCDCRRHSIPLPLDRVEHAQRLLKTIHERERQGIIASLNKSVWRPR